MVLTSFVLYYQDLVVLNKPVLSMCFDDPTVEIVCSGADHALKQINLMLLKADYFELVYFVSEDEGISDGSCACRSFNSHVSSLLTQLKFLFFK